MATLSPKILKLGEIWQLVFDKTGTFSPEIWICVAFLAIFRPRKKKEKKSKTALDSGERERERGPPSLAHSRPSYCAGNSSTGQSFRGKQNYDHHVPALLLLWCCNVRLLDWYLIYWRVFFSIEVFLGFQNLQSRNLGFPQVSWRKKFETERKILGHRKS